MLMAPCILAQHPGPVWSLNSHLSYSICIITSSSCGQSMQVFQHSNILRSWIFIIGCLSRINVTEFYLPKHLKFAHVFAQLNRKQQYPRLGPSALGVWAVLPQTHSQLCLSAVVTPVKPAAAVVKRDSLMSGFKCKV